MSNRAFIDSLSCQLTLLKKVTVRSIDNFAAIEERSIVMKLSVEALKQAEEGSFGSVISPTSCAHSATKALHTVLLQPLATQTMKAKLILRSCGLRKRRVSHIVDCGHSKGF